jgi:hypothetical protein
MRTPVGFRQKMTDAGFDIKTRHPSHVPVIWRRNWSVKFASFLSWMKGFAYVIGFSSRGAGRAKRELRGLCGPPKASFNRAVDAFTRVWEPNCVLELNSKQTVQLHNA